jgi:hypothetical protein
MRITNTNKMQKTDWKNIANSQSYGKKSDFDPTSWIDPQYLAGTAKFDPRSYCWSKLKHVTLILSRHLGHLLVSAEKLIL